jgi:dihydroorotate dehydrogenase electron transfer subunit
LSGWRGRAEAMRVRRLTAVEEEARGMKSLYFIDELCSCATPGQYVMIWDPEAEEVPMSLSTINPWGPSSVLVRPVGESTEALCRLKKGDRVGLRGPFGNGYEIRGSSPLMVAGGTGVASLTPLAERMVSIGLKPTFVMGARSGDQLALRGRLEKLLGGGLLLATDDGSCGFRGFASEYAARLMGERSFDSVYTCGPELMMVAVFEEAEKRGMRVQASLERYMKCAVGLCGSCAIGAIRICKDGPVLDTKQLRIVRDEFGKTRMDPSGRFIRVDH